MAPVSAAGVPYSVDVEKGRIIVSVDSEAFSPGEISDFLDYMYLESIRRRASLSDEQVSELADEVDAAVWKRLRPMVEEKLRGG